MNIVNVGYDSTNYYVLGEGDARLLVDLGWPGTLPKLLGALKRTGVELGQIRHMLATHYHPDHAGLAQDLKARGVRLIVLEQQLAAIPVLKSYTKPNSGYLEITLHDNVRLSCAESRAFLQRLGFAGEIVGTPGHSDDSVTLVLDEGAAFTGDLTPPHMAGEDNAEALTRSWERLRALGVRMVYPGHGPARPLEQIL
jgi:ribonuclease/clavin/mitogillin